MWTLRTTRPRSGVNSSLLPTGTAASDVKANHIYSQHCEWTPADRDPFLLRSICFHPLPLTGDGAVSATFAKTLNSVFFTRIAKNDMNFQFILTKSGKEPTRTSRQREQMFICHRTLAFCCILHVHVACAFLYEVHIHAPSDCTAYQLDNHGWNFKKKLYYSSYLGLSGCILSSSVSLHIIRNPFTPNWPCLRRAFSFLYLHISCLTAKHATRAF